MKLYSYIVLLFVALLPHISMSKSFEEYCKDESTDASTKHTVSQVLDYFDTADCAEPRRRINQSRSLILRYRAIEELSPLSGFENLERLNLTGNNISDLSPLLTLKNLKRLMLGNNQIKNIEHLTSIQGLEFVVLKGNLIESIHGIDALLDSLWYLDLADNPIADYKPILKLSKLQKLAIGRSDRSKMGGCIRKRVVSGSFKTKISELKNLRLLQLNYLDFSDTKEIEKLKHLEILHIDCNNLGHTDVLNQLPNLYNFSAAGNNLTSIAANRNLSSLEYLDLSGNYLKKFDSFQHIGNIKDLIIANNSISSIVVDVDLEHLYKLDLSSNTITKFIMKGSFTSLDTLNLRHNGIEEINFQMMPSQVRLLYLDHNLLQSIDKIGALSFVKEVFIGNNPIRDISPVNTIDPEASFYLNVDGLKGVNYLSIENPKIRLLALSGATLRTLNDVPSLPNLSGLYLTNSPIKSISGILKKFPKLRSLSVRNTLVDDISPLSDTRAILFLDLSDTLVHDFSPLEKIGSIYRLSVAGLGLGSFKSLSGLKGVEFLDASSNSIVDLSQVPPNLLRLQRLDVSFNRIANISGLGRLRGLRRESRLKLDFNPLGWSIEKNETNCPTKSLSVAVNTWCMKF